MESFDLNIDNLEPITLDFDSGSTGGAELLMNIKKVSPQSSNIDLGDLDSFEAEMNNLSSASTAPSSSGDTRVLSGLSNFFSFGGSKEEESVKTGLGQATKETGSGTTKTWD